MHSYFSSKQCRCITAFLQRAGLHLFLGILCSIAECSSTSGNTLHQAVFLSPECAYLLWSWQLSTTKVLCRYHWKIYLDGEKNVPSGCFPSSSLCQSSCWQQPGSSRGLSFIETLLVRSVLRQISSFFGIMLSDRFSLLLWRQLTTCIEMK